MTIIRSSTKLPQPHNRNHNHTYNDYQANLSTNFDNQAKHQLTTTTNLSTKLQVEVVVCLLPQVPPEFWRGGEINFMMF